MLLFKTDWVNIFIKLVFLYQIKKMVLTLFFPTEFKLLICYEMLRYEYLHQIILGKQWKVGRNRYEKSYYFI